VGVPVNSSADLTKFGAGGSEIRVLPAYFFSFAAEDLRRDVTVADFEITSANMREVRDKLWEYNPGKWRTWWSTVKSSSSYTGINHILLRYSDVLLMFAEADNWLNNGPTPEAIDALKQVRKRAYKGNESIVDSETYPSDRDGFFNVIMQERAWELGTEGVRKWDLIRWNKLGEALENARAAFEAIRNDPAATKYVYYLPVSDPDEPNPEIFSDASSIGEPYLSEGYKRKNYKNGLTAAIVTYVGYAFEWNKDELFPFPASATQANPGLTQHPGY
jgi:hypothetical protein